MNTIYKALIALTALLPLTSCKTYIDIPLESAERVPTVSFLGSTDQDPSAQSYLYLSRTHYHHPDPLSGASVRISVNGNATTTMGEQAIPSGYTPYYSTYEALGLAFAPGDVVDLDITTPQGERLTASQKVPARPKLVSAKVLPLESRYYSSYGRTLRLAPVSVTLTDDASENNYYRLRMQTRPVHVDSETGKVTYGEFVSARVVYYQDFILMDGNPKATSSDESDLDIFGEGTATNDYLVFSDALFSGSEATLNIKVDEWSLSGKVFVQPASRVPGRYESGSYEPASYIEIHVQLEGLTADAYHYYRSVGVVASSDYDEENPFVTPVKVYSNVRGGTGIFAISSTSSSLTLRCEAVEEYSYPY